MNSQKSIDFCKILQKNENVHDLAFTSLEENTKFQPSLHKGSSTLLKSDVVLFIIMSDDTKVFEQHLVVLKINNRLH